MRLGKFLRQAIDVIEIAIGLVFVFLIKLGIVESFVIEFGTCVLMIDRLDSGLRRWLSRLSVRN